jgi:acyl-CoA thioester hydrolase
MNHSMMTSMNVPQENKTAGNRPFEVSIDFMVKTYDIDAAKHVSNIVYIRWLEDLRMRALEVYYPLEKLYREGISPVILRTDIEYMQAIQLFDRPKGILWMDKMEGLRIYLSAQFVVNGKIVCQAHQTGIFIDIEKQKPVRIPEGFRKQYEAARSH